MATITASTPNPTGGIIDRDAAGEPTGILRENAVELVTKLIPPLEENDYVQAVLAACKLALAAGLTTVHCIIGSSSELTALLKLRSQGLLPLRFYALIPSKLLMAAKAMGLRSGFGDEWVRVGGVKVFTDGSLGARTAALDAPYADDPGNQGVTVCNQQELDDLVTLAHLSDFQVAVHAIGDRAAGMVVHAVAKAHELAPGRKLRHRIEHASVLSGELIRRISDLGLVASVQPHFIVSDSWMEQRLGAERAAFAYPFRSLARAGVMIVGGSDCPVEPLTPLSGIQAAVNREGGEAVAVEDAIAYYTRNAAYASFEENIKGTISPGKLADLVILERDPRNVAPSMISKIRVVSTVVAGKVAYEDGTRAPLVASW
jgi:predicted amidohydrolase YtcJ